MSEFVLEDSILEYIDAFNEKREKIIMEMAHIQYIRDCAWVDYLNGVGTQLPV